MSAHLNIQIVTGRQIATRARQHARAIGKRGIRIKNRERRLGHERFDFMIEIKAPRIEIGSSIELDYPNGRLNRINDLLRKKVLHKIDDVLISEISGIVKVASDACDYEKEEAQRIIDFLNTHKGRRCYAKWW